MPGVVPCSTRRAEPRVAGGGGVELARRLGRAPPRAARAPATGSTVVRDPRGRGARPSRPPTSTWRRWRPLGADPADAVALEDSAHGCTAAVAAGLYARGRPNAVTQGQDFTHADLVVESLAEVDLDRLAAAVAARASSARADASPDRGAEPPIGP